MRRTWSVYATDTGLFTGKTFSCGDADIRANVPVGMAVIEGRHDDRSKRVDLESGLVVDWQPPKPDDDHEWDHRSGRWVIKALAAARINRRNAARSRIEELERSQARRVRELLKDDPRLAEIDAEIEALRADL